MGLDADLKQIALQERDLQFVHFDQDTAWRLGCHLRSLAAERGAPVVIDIRRFGQQLFFTALPGTAPDNLDWVRRKGNTVERFLRSSYAIGLELKEKNTDLAEKYALPVRDYAAHGGSFPLALTGAPAIGSITVSGLPQREDHEMVVEALCAELGKSLTQLGLAPPE